MLIIGLGNIGREYENTYHNMGFDVVEKLAKSLNVRFSRTECKSKVAVYNNNGARIVIAKPTTYMNLSGEAVRELMGKYKEDLKNVIIIYDDIDIPLGTLRARENGSAGTHNGMRNIVECVGSKEFKRLRIGTGFDRGEIPLYNIVLSKIKGDNKTLLDGATDKSAEALKEYIETGNFEKLMRDVNGYSPK